MADFSHFPSQVKIVEVGPRDGLQNEQKVIPTEVKVRLINDLLKAGLATVEATSFVSPKWVPQLADAADVMAALELDSAAKHPVLVPNMRGFENALAAGAREVAVFTAASNSFNIKNINCDITESLARIAPIMTAAKAENITVRGYVSCVLGCPYEGAIAPQAVADVSQALVAMGCYEISLGDTIGIGHVESTRILLEHMTKQLPSA
ncbi:MAG: hydroxymethylglutaryl-CoA lyase, partial [Enterobacterales bacterium]|nr:hydroxymethylglutaryl-CoA lyase [Enterobacterales bacterium]